MVRIERLKNRVLNRKRRKGEAHIPQKRRESEISTHMSFRIEKSPYLNFLFDEQTLIDSQPRREVSNNARLHS